MSNPALDWLAGSPKVELHLHLDGALRVDTALQLAQQSNWQGFRRPLSREELHRCMVVRGIPGSQRGLLAYFTIPGRLLQTRAALSRAACELLRDRAADGVRYCEIRFAPLLHTVGRLSAAEAVEAVLEGCRQGRADTGVGWGVIVVGMRHMTVEQNLSMLASAAPYRDQGVVAADLAGDEETHPDPVRFRAYFHRAKQLGLKITLHCGETGHSLGYLQRALDALHPHRIAHGAVAEASPAICRQLRERDVMLELCPTSNIQVGVYPGYQQFPLAKLHRAGVPVCVSTDDPVLSNTTLAREYAHMLAIGLEAEELWQMNLAAARHCFASPTEKQALLASLLAWRAENPPPR